MRVLVLENEPSSKRGGQEQSLFDVCRGLAARGHRIELLYTSDGDLLEGYRAFCARVDRVAAYSVDRTRPAPAVFRMLRDGLLPGRAAPDVVYANQYLDSLFARLLAWRFHRPFVCHLRLPPPDIFCGQYRWGMGGAARLIATSKRTRDDYIARGFRPDRIDVVYNGIDTRAWSPSPSRAIDRERLGVGSDDLLGVYAGRLYPGKGIEVLIDAFATLPGPGHLVIAGTELDDGSGIHYTPYLHARARERGITSRCHFVGHVGRIAELFGAADVAVLPSLIPETFGRVVIEAMACETPVIASRTGGIPEILTGEFDDHLFDPGDAIGLAARLKGLRDWRRLDPGLGRRCRAHVEQRFDLTRTVEGVEATLRRTVDEWSAGAALRAAGEVIH
jgi:glycosyltransferase involved in cell wall biosynthesis